MAEAVKAVATSDALDAAGKKTPKQTGAPAADLTDEEAAAAAALAKNSVQLEKRFVLPILKATESGDLRLVTGPVLIPDTVDAQGDVITAEEIQKAAHTFLIEYNEQTQIAYMHKDFKRPLALVESYIAPIDFEYEGRSVVKGTWIVTVKVLDEDTWQAVKKGEIRGFSIGGTAFGEDLTATE